MKPIMNSISVWFGITMVIVVLVLAGMVAFTDSFDDRLYGNKRIFFIFLLLAYAVYRGVRLYQVLKRPKHED